MALSVQKQVVLRYAELVSRGEVEKFEEVMEADFVFENAEGDRGEGIDIMRRAWSNFRSVLGNDAFAWEILEMFEEDKVVCASWVLHCRHDGDYKGYAPTHRTAPFRGMSIYRFSDNGKLRHFFGYPNTLQFLHDLDLFQLPTPA